MRITAECNLAVQIEGKVATALPVSQPGKLGTQGRIQQKTRRAKRIRRAAHTQCQVWIVGLHRYGTCRNAHVTAARAADLRQQLAVGKAHVSNNVIKARPARQKLERRMVNLEGQLHRGVMRQLRARVQMQADEALGNVTGAHRLHKPLPQTGLEHLRQIARCRLGASIGRFQHQGQRMQRRIPRLLQREPARHMHIACFYLEQPAVQREAAVAIPEVQRALDGDTVECLVVHIGKAERDAPGKNR